MGRYLDTESFFKTARHKDSASLWEVFIELKPLKRHQLCFFSLCHTKAKRLGLGLKLMLVTFVLPKERNKNINSVAYISFHYLVILQYMFRFNGWGLKASFYLYFLQMKANCLMKM